MNPNIFIAHILAFHLNVPEAVNIQFESFPFEGIEAQISLREDNSWLIKYDSEYWQAHKDSRKAFVLSHELCHTIYKDSEGWNNLDNKGKSKKQKYADNCAKKILRDHKKCPRK